MLRKSRISSIRYIINPEGLSHWDEYGLKDAETLIDWCRQFLSPDKNMLDIGANVGIYALELASHCKNVYAFEPQRMVYYQLCGGIALSQQKNIIAYNVALGSLETCGTEQEITIMNSDCTGSSLDPIKIAREREVQPDNILGTEKVILRSLDSFNLQDIGFIKLDVEGYELEVLQGAVTTLERSGYPRILFEAWHQYFNRPSREKLFSYLQALGYEIVPINHYQHMFLATHPKNISP